MITFLLYLNNDYTGGETTFPKLDIVNRGVDGRRLLFHQRARGPLARSQHAAYRLSSYGGREVDRLAVHPRHPAPSLSSPPATRAAGASIPVSTDQNFIVKLTE